jgi:hypothetical protein
MNGGPSHVDTFDPKPALDKYAGKPLPTANLRTERKTGARCPRRSSSRSTAKRHRGQRACSPHAAAHRRHRRHPLDARRRAQPRAVADADELRRRPAGPAQPRLLGDLRPGHREPEPARLHRHVPRRLSDPGVAELAGGFPARRLPGNLHRHAHTDAREADREHPQQLFDPAASSASSSTCCQLNQHLQQRARRRASSKPASSRSSWPTACRWTPPTPSTSAASRSTSATCTAPACRPGNPDRPPAAGARRALRAGLARRGAALGQPRRHRGQATAGWPQCDQPIAALQDLKQRGMLDDTLVIWGGEFGRTPVGRAADARLERRQDRPRPQPLRLHHVAGRRRRQGRLQSTAPPTNSASGRREPRPRPRPARHDPAPAGLRPRRSSPTATPAATSG